MIYLISNQQSIEDAYERANINDVVEYCKSKEILGIDIETTKKYNNYKDEGLDPYTSKIVMLQIGDLENQFIIDTRSVDIEDLLPLFESDILFVGHNLKFEYKHLLHNYNVKLNSIYDTMITEQVLYNGLNKKNGLKDLALRYLDLDIEKETRLNFLTIGSRPFNSKEILYGANDIIYPLKIRLIQLNAINEFNVSKAIALEMEFIKVLGDIEYKGIYFDSNIWLETYEENLVYFNKYLDILNDYVLSNNFTNFINNQLSLFQEGVSCSIEWTSSSQVVEFFKYLEFCPRVAGKKSGYSVEATELKKLLNKDNFEYKELVNNYLTFKEYEQSITTFGKDFLKYINPITGRIHSDYRQILNTGRISSSQPNMQNIPRKENFRRAFSAPAGHVIINADYSGQESVVLANKSLDKGMVDFYLNGTGDLHSYAATLMYRIIYNDAKLVVTKETHPEERQNAKELNFKLAYGASAFTVKDTLGGISEKEAQEFIDIYFEAFPGLKIYFDKCRKDAIKNGYVIIDEITNRRWWFSSQQAMKQAYEDADWSTYYKLKGSLERNSQNYPIQGTSGNITKMAGIKFRNRIRERGLDEIAFINNMVHDEINVQCLESYKEQVAKLLEDCMKNAGNIWCQTVKLNADAVISNYWNH